MRNERIENRRNQRRSKGISSFVILLVLTSAVALVGMLLMFLAIRLLIAPSGDLDKLALLLAVVNFSMLAILMVFFYLSLRCLNDLKEATEAAERGDDPEEYGDDGSVADLISVVGRVSTRMDMNSEKKARIAEDYQAFVPRGILEYCHVDMHKEITPGIIGAIKGTRVIIVLGNYKAGTDPRQFTNLVDRIIGRGGRMLSSTSECICAIFPGKQEEDVRFIEAELKDSQILKVRYGTFDIIMAGSRTSMFVRARDQNALGSC